MKRSVLLLILLPLLLLLSDPLLAQLPQPGQLSRGAATSPEIQSELESLLGLNENDIMAGLTGYDVDLGALLGEKLADELAKSLADATVFAVPATEILAAYQKQKMETLAKEIQKTRAVVKDALGRLNKIRYQDFKLRYEKKRAMSQLPDMIGNSARMQQATDRTTGLYGRYADVVNEFYDSPELTKLLRAGYNGHYYGGTKNDIGYYLIGTAAGYGDAQGLETKTGLSKRTGDVVRMSPYERMELQRDIDREAAERHRLLMAMRTELRAAIQYQLRQQQKRQYGRTLHLPSARLP